MLRIGVTDAIKKVTCRCLKEVPAVDSSARLGGGDSAGLATGSDRGEQPINPRRLQRIRHAIFPKGVAGQPTIVHLVVIADTLPETSARQLWDLGPTYPGGDPSLIDPHQLMR
jgi:hypothetical protein